MPSVCLWFTVIAALPQWKKKLFLMEQGGKTNSSVGASVSMCWCLNECLTGFHFLAVASGVVPVLLNVVSITFQ